MAFFLFRYPLDRAMPSGGESSRASSPSLSLPSVESSPFSVTDGLWLNRIFPKGNTLNVPSTENREFLQPPMADIPEVDNDPLLSEAAALQRAVEENPPVWDEGVEDRLQEEEQLIRDATKRTMRSPKQVTAPLDEEEGIKESRMRHQEKKWDRKSDPDIDDE